MTTDYLSRALERIEADENLKTTEEDVQVHGLSADGLEYTVVVDRGIKGSPKYRFPVKELRKAAKAKSEPAPAYEPDPFYSPYAPVGATSEDYETEGDETAAELEALSYRDLQALAKAYDIPANQSAEELIAAIQEKGQ